MDDRYYTAAILESGVGAAGLGILRKSMQHAETMWHASRAELLAAGLAERATGALLAARQTHPNRPQEIAARIGALGITVIAVEDAAYPARLKEIHLPPPLLFCMGDTALLSTSAIAVVGARKATAYGKSAAMELSRDLAGYGFTIVSGGARGIDSAAHQGALLSGRTIAVLGAGVNVVYPKENGKLFAKIRERGLMVSEYTPDTQPLPAFFPMRNRIIAGIAQGTLVVEAARRSGARITAEIALSEGRDVFAVPGSIYSDLSTGTNQLIQQGAKLVMCAEDIRSEYVQGEATGKGIQGQEDMPTGLSEDELSIYRCLSKDTPLTVDEIICKTHGNTAHVAFLLLSMQLKGLVVETDGQAYLRSIC